MTRRFKRLLVLAALLGAAQPCLADTMLAAVDPKIYLYRQSNGVRVYTDRKPEDVAYQIIEKYGRPTATASCMGLTSTAMAEREASYGPLIRKHALAQGISAGLVRAVMRVESCFDRRAVSKVGARGLMQLMPATAADMGVSDSFDADQNIGGGTKYLKMMLDRFRQDNSLALAAYNAGPGAVDKHGGIPPFVETQKYVRRVLDYYRSHPT